MRLRKKVVIIALPVLMIVGLLLSGWVALHTLPEGINLRAQPIYSVSPEQKKQLLHNDQAVKILFFSSQNTQLTQRIDTEFQLLKNDISQATIQFIDVFKQPLLAQKYQVNKVGQTVLLVGDKSHKFNFFSAPLILEALLNDKAENDGFIVHLVGQGERDFLADTPNSWRSLYQNLKSMDFKVVSMNVGEIPIPNNTALLVIADPDSHQYAAIDSDIKRYINEGGNLIYTTDTFHRFLPEILQEIGGLKIKREMLHDKISAANAYHDNRIILSENNQIVPLSKTLQEKPIFPGVLGLLSDEKTSQWQRQVVLTTGDDTWIEVDQGQKQKIGKTPIAWLLSRDINGKHQEILILGDSDLWSSNVFFVAGNKQFALNSFTQLSNRSLSQIELPRRQDQFIQLSENALIGLAIFLLLILPILLLLISMAWHRRFIRRYGV